MAFDVNGFNYTRGFIGSSASNLSSTIHCYNSPDTLSTITTPGYFPNFFGLPILVVVNKDTIRISASDGVQDLLVTDTATGTIQILPINYPIVTTLTQTISLDGIWAVPHNVDFDFIRADYGNGVVITQITCEAGALFPATASSVITFGSPLTYQPVGGGNQIHFIGAVDNATVIPGRFYMDNLTAQIALFSPAINYSGLSGSGDSGFNPFSISYAST